MKRHFLLTVFAVSALTLYSCAANRGFRSSVSPAEIGGLAMLEPLADISIIRKGDRAEHCDSLSALSRELLTNTVMTLDDIPPISDVIYLDDKQEAVMFFEGLRVLREWTSGNADYSNIPVPGPVNDVMMRSGARFGLIVLSDGFTRTSSNYAGRVAGDVGIIAASFLLSAALGAVFPDSDVDVGIGYSGTVKARSNMSVIIVDTVTQEVVYANSLNMTVEPLKEGNVRRQLKRIMRKYFKD